MSTKNKKIVYYLAAFLVVLMLVCTCLLGNTFARYVSSGSGTASVKVADWSITEGTLSGSGTASFSQINGLSPNHAAYTTTPTITADPSAGTCGVTSGNYYRWNATESQTVATITNNSSVVDATVTVTTLDSNNEDTIEIAFSNSIVQDSSGNLYYDNAMNGTQGQYDVNDTDTGYKLSDIEGLFEIVLTNYTGTLSNGQTLTVAAYVVWTSDDGSVAGSVADARDTFVGNYVTAVSWILSWSAVQAETVR